MVIRFSDTEKFSVKEGTIWDYPLPTEDIGISYQTFKGRGPLKGQYLNKVCKEIFFIIKGNVKFSINGKEYNAGPHDVVIIEPNTPHSFETEELEYITITSPNWYEEQHEEIA